MRPEGAVVTLLPGGNTSWRSGQRAGGHELGDAGDRGGGLGASFVSWIKPDLKAAPRL